MIIALDLGEKYVGLAVSFDRKIALARASLKKEMLVDELKRIKKEEKVEKVIIGLPIGLSGKETKQGKKIKREATLLKKKLKLKVDFFDERLTSVQAKRSGVAEPHSEAARLILQSYLDRTENLKPKKLGNDYE